MWSLCVTGSGGWVPTLRRYGLSLNRESLRLPADHPQFAHAFVFFRALATQPEPFWLNPELVFMDAFARTFSPA